MTRFQPKRAWAMATKEIAHVRRDPFTIALALILPLLVVFIFGLSIEFNLTEIHTAVVDSDKSAASRALVETLGSSGYFRTFSARTASEGLDAIQSDNARALIVIPPNFEKNLFSGKSAEAQAIVDGSDGSVVSSVLGYLGQIQNRALARVLGVSSAGPLEMRTRFLFNPEMSTRWFIVPGLTVVILAILSVLLTALTVAREWENGSMELLLSTPVEPLEVVAGKLFPYAILGLIATAIVYVLARVFFGVPFAGNHLVFGMGALLFLMTCLAQGLLISIVVRKQTLAMQFAMLTALLPSLLLSGFIFQIESMPRFFRALTAILPARWFMNIARDSFLQGSSLWDLAAPFLALFLLSALLVSLCALKFKKDVEP